MNEERKMGADGLKALGDREGRKLRAYKDTRGNWTIGTGSIAYPDGRRVRPGDTITSTQADEMLAFEVSKVEKALRAVLRVPVTQNEWDAMVSLYFNVGIGYLKTASASSVVRELNLGNVGGAAKAFMNYSKPPEIIGRRKGEMLQFLKPDATRPEVSEARTSVLLDRSDEAKGVAGAVTLGAGAGLVVAAGAGAVLLPAHPIAGAAVVGTGLVASSGLGILAWAKRSLARALSFHAWAQH